MPEAIDTKRRRFTKALDNITGSQDSLTPSKASSVTSTKRSATATAAFDEARDRAAKRLRRSTSRSSRTPVTVPSTAAPKQEDSKSKEPPNFAPWSHEAFLSRLKTFSSVSLWHPKPEAISEVEWSKRGWVCVGVNTVACRGGCEKRVVVSVDPPKKASTDCQEDDEEAADAEDGDEDEAAFEQAIVSRYKDVIVEGHSENCLWRKSGCKDDIYHLQVVRPSIWQPQLRQRNISALVMPRAIERVKLRSLERNGSSSLTSERLLKDVPHDVLSDHRAMSQAAQINALDIALHGWRGETESGTQLLHCDACFQRIGLWMYQPDYRPAHSKPDDEDSQDAATIDLVEMHRDHCSWRNATTQKASGSLSGLNACQILLRVVSTYAREQRRRSDEKSGAVLNDQPGQQNATENVTEELPVLSREEVAQKDKERESRLRRLKSLFTIKRRSKQTAPKAAVS